MSVEGSSRRLSLEEVLKMLRSRFGNLVKDVKVISRNQAVVTVTRDALPKVVLYLLKEAGIPEAQLSTVVGIDETPIKGFLSVTYWVSSNAGGGDVWVGVRAYLTLDDPVIKSVTPQHPGANWYERENRDLLGIVPEGHPDPRRLVLPDDFPDGVYPLRKDYDYRRKDFSKPSYPFRMPSKDTIIVPFGPYHVACDEPFHFRLFVKGEEIIDAEYRGFYNYRGIEKIAESRLTYDQIPFIAERICGICGYTHACAYCQAVEAAAGIDVPERALYVRSILLEIERLHSHLLWFGVAYHVLGFDTGFMAMWRIREEVMRVAEALTGNRKTYGMNLVGGVRRDIDVKKATLVLRMLERVEREFKEFYAHTLAMGEVVERVKEVGILTREDAAKLGAVGPHARASGLSIDVRADHPYAAYGFVDVNVAVQDSCDVLARIIVRYEEVLESIRLIREFLTGMPEGELMAEDVDIPPLRVGIGATEAPRGEDVHVVVTGGGNKVYRWRPRAPSYMNLATVPTMLKGERLANVPIIIASIDPCFSCTDHVLVVDARTGAKRVLRLSALSERGCGGWAG